MIAGIPVERLVDIVLAVTIIEMIVIRLWRGRREAGPLIIGILPGLLLILALRAAFGDAPEIWVPVLLTLALPAHLLDLRIRMARSRKL